METETGGPSADPTSGDRSAKKSEQMRRIRTQGTQPELAVRSALHRLGYRFRLNRKDLPGTPDLVLPKWRIALFVHGCFWHGCTRCDRGRRKPKTNAALWNEKITSNMHRDARVRGALEEMGWTVITIWECQVRDTGTFQRVLKELLPPRSAQRIQPNSGRLWTSSPGSEECRSASVGVHPSA